MEPLSSMALVTRSLILHTDLYGDPLFKAELLLASRPKSGLFLTTIHPPVGKPLVISGP